MCRSVSVCCSDTYRAPCVLHAMADVYRLELTLKRSRSKIQRAFFPVSMAPLALNLPCTHVFRWLLDVV